MRTTLSEFLVAIRVPWRLNIAPTTSYPRVLSTPISAPVLAFHNRAVASPDQVNTCSVSGLKRADQTEPACPLNTATAVPVAASQSRAVRSSEAVKMRVSLALNDAPHTRSSCPRRTKSVAPVLESHTRTVPSQWDVIT